MGQLEAAAAGAELELLDELSEEDADEDEDEAFSDDSDEPELSELLAEPFDELLLDSRLSVR